MLVIFADQSVSSLLGSTQTFVLSRGFQSLLLILYTGTVLLNLKLQKQMPPIPLIMSSEKDSPEQDIILETRPKTKRPPLYKVLLLNDDYTPMEFVVIVLERFFGKTHTQAFEIMLVVHKKGLAVVGVFSHEVAETKVSQVMDFSRKHQHPLVCTMEKE